ncbi:hypothetical protein DXG01_004997 [Tephrocybe rancida]|nr:hypothetical protein DXG01_004997 [Tephrocybe rancida]
MNFNATTHTLPSPLLRPSWRPFFPKNLPAPPPLPRDPMPGCVLVLTSPAALRTRKSLAILPSSSQASFASLRKQPQRQIPKEMLADGDDLDVPEFGPLPSYCSTASFWSEEIAIWQPPTMFDMDVARPQRMLDGPVSETPISISYTVFAKYVDSLERKGPP